MNNIDELLKIYLEKYHFLTADLYSVTHILDTKRVNMHSFNSIKVTLRK